jgi:hypothetical protein
MAEIHPGWFRLGWLDLYDLWDTGIWPLLAADDDEEGAE